MKQILLTLTLIFIASAKLQATEALIFDGGGYNIYILVGFGDEPQPVIAQVRFTAPGAKDWVPLPREHLKIEKFDYGSTLIIHFSNKQKAPDLPGAFSLSVTKKKAVLSINGKKIKSTFDWLDE